MSYIKLDRKMLEWGWYTDNPVCRLWTHILLKANWTISTFMGTKIPRGAFVTSLTKLSAETGLSEKQVRGALRKLETTGEITCEKTNKYTLICVSKWDEYQGGCDEKGTQMEGLEGTPQGTPQGNSIRNKEVKNKRNILYKPTIEDVRAYCLERRNNVDPQRFIDYYTANGWRVGKNPMKDWKACVRTWERNTKVDTANDTIPVYSTDRNTMMSTEDEEELLKLMGRTE